VDNVQKYNICINVPFSRNLDLKFYALVAPPALGHGSGCLESYTKDIYRMQSAGVSHLRTDTGCTRLDHITKEAARKELEVQSMQNKIYEHR
jgi:hypothetical protein